MMRLVALGALLALTGCGTFANVQVPREQAGWGKPQLDVYGGVANDVWFMNYVSGRDGAKWKLATAAAVMDVPLSALADTLTLPITLCAAVGRGISNGINDYYFPKKPPGEETAWRRYWFEEQKPSPPESNGVKRAGEPLPTLARPPAP